MSKHLPKYYLITPDFEGNLNRFQQALKNSLTNGVRLVQLRSKNLNVQEYINLAKNIVPMIHEHDGTIILNGSVELLSEVRADGIHFTSGSIATCKTSRPVGKEFLMSAACHNLEQLLHAKTLGADLAILCPVFATPSSPLGNPIGWENFHKYVKQVDLPIYALGGLQPGDYPIAISNGAYGLAAKRGLWNLSCALQADPKHSYIDVKT